MQRGFSLVELLVSVVILAIGLVALSQLYLAALWTYHCAQYTSIAAERAQQELETVQRLGADSYTPLTDSTPSCYPSTVYTSYSAGHGVQFQVPELPRGHGTVVITKNPFLQTPASDYQQLASAVITITWQPSSTKQSTVSLITYLTPRGAKP
ncbi:MAG TPA: prepilin-type N-terminal cleavage/methylation domain-containing protein [Armatimonadota bacterium]|nr:prepilin-type N-terminal cleavage/methylation domain-containing protein [Armatimonadota bacterium]